MVEVEGSVVEGEVEVVGVFVVWVLTVIVPVWVGVVVVGICVVVASVMIVGVEAWVVVGVVEGWVFVMVVSVAIAASAVVCAVEILVRSESTSEEVQVKSLLVSVSRIFTRASALVGL